MLKYRFRSVAFLVGLVLASQAAAWADTVEGRVARSDAQRLDLVVYDAQGRPYPNQLRLKVDSRTRFQGVTSAARLRRDDAVSADVRQEESGIWRADNVVRFEQLSAQPATQKPSPSLQGALRDPVVRGALTGAATGAIASSASGGKAGKGALIGAGVGAAAGLLGNMFGNSSQSSQDGDSR